MPTPAPPPVDTAEARRWPALARDLDALHDALRAKVGAEDLAHMTRLERWGRLCSAAGYATAWIAPNPLSALLLCLGNTARFTIVAHHVAHGVFDAVPGAPERRTSRAFGAGLRGRLVDWPDWILTEAWRAEHSIHHAHTGEPEDPDLVELNTRGVHGLPWLVKALVILFFACTWKVSYFAPTTFEAFLQARDQRLGLPSRGPIRERYSRLFLPWWEDGRAFWARCLLPYALGRFVALPLLFLPLGAWAAASVLVNSLLAEVLTNVHTFLLIVSSHAGEDLHRFERRAGSRAEFYRRQLLTTSNYTSESEVGHFLQGYVNFQIEHHLFPTLPPLRLREARPLVRAVCERHGVPYREESLWRRAARLLAIITGARSMRLEAAEEPRAPGGASPACGDPGATCLS